MGVPYEGNGFARLSFVTWITSFEIVLLLLSVGVLGIAFLMFVRLSDALSPPTKALTWVVGSNVALALFLLAFACFQMHHFARKEFVPQGGIFCHWFNPIILALVVFGWLGQPVIAWTTLKTLRNEAVTDQKLRRIFFGCVGVALFDYAWGVSLSPGVIVNGSFCVMVPNTPDTFDARSFANVTGLATFITSIVLYVKSYRHLRRLKLKLAKDLKRIGRGGPSGEKAKESSLASVGSGTHVSQSRWRWGSEGEGWRVVGGEGDAEKGQGAGLGDHGADVRDSSSDEEEDAPFTYAELQERTQAARRAVNILLPDRTDDMAGREGPYGARRQRGGGRGTLLEEGVDLSALVGSTKQPHKPLAAAAAATARDRSPRSDGRDKDNDEQERAEGSLLSWRNWGWRRQQRRQRLEEREEKEEGEDLTAEVVKLCDKAMRAVVGRGCTLMTIYYVPSYVLFFCLALYKNYRPPPDVLPIFALVFFLGTPVLQTVALLHLAVTIGKNILQFYRQYVGGGPGPDDGDGQRVGVSVGEGEEGKLEEGMALPPPLTITIKAVGPQGEEETERVGGSGFLYEQQDTPRAAARVVPSGASTGVGGNGGGAVPTAQEARAAVVDGSSQRGPSLPHAPAPGTVSASSLLQRPPAHPKRGAPGPLGVPPPSSLRRYGSNRGRKGGPHAAAAGARQQQHMPALSTIYEVAFKSKGRDAAAAFRNLSAPTPGAVDGGNAAAAAGAVGAGGPLPVAGKADPEHKRPLERKSDGGREVVVGAADAGSHAATTTVVAAGPASSLSLSSSMATTLQQNALVQEMLGIKVRRSSSSANSSLNSSAAGSVASSLSEDMSDGAAGPAEGDAVVAVDAISSTSASGGGGGGGGGFFPWRGLRVRSRSASLSADHSEISSLTDAHDYQIGSLASSLGGSPVRPPRPAQAPSKQAVLDASGHSDGREGVTSLDTQSNGRQSGSSWGEASRTRGAMVAAGTGGGAASVAGQTHASGSSVASSASSSSLSLVSDGGRSIVTESDWREWQVRKDGGGGRDGLPQLKQPQQSPQQPPPQQPVQPDITIGTAQR